VRTKRAQQWSRDIVHERRLRKPSELMLAEQAAFALSRAERARVQLHKDGETCRDAKKRLRHPLMIVVRDARATFLQYERTLQPVVRRA
jgi:hypothetical protein